MLEWRQRSDRREPGTFFTPSTPIKVTRPRRRLPRSPNTRRNNRAPRAGGDAGALIALKWLPKPHDLCNLWLIEFRPKIRPSVEKALKIG
jgi:hypothetical protein